jgi:Protein of unknown function (DUF3025)
VAPGLSAIDWTRPWLAPWRDPGEALARQVRAGAGVAEVLNGAVRAPVNFVPQAELPMGRAYESHIAATGCVPTRDGLHDFFNGLCWMRYPRTKRRLNQLQAAAIAAAGVGSVRGPVRDALTLFDENAALLHAPDALWQALRVRDWRRLFVDLRPLWAEARLLVFGHAALEQLVQPYKGITVHVWRIGPDLGDPGEVDAHVAEALSPFTLVPKPFLPLPVLGVPGWWPPNADPVFYGDARVFRPMPVRLPTAAVPAGGCVAPQ